jgi:hypothetical protein
MATASAVGFWAISSWVPPYAGSVAAKAGFSGPQWASYTAMTFTAFGFLADAYGRKPITLLSFAMSLLLTPVMFLWASNLYVLQDSLRGCPRGYPTRMRATGAGFIFNASRIPAACGVLIAGALIVYFGGYGNAAMTIATIYLLGLAIGPFLPETAGKPLACPFRKRHPVRISIASD